MIRNSNSTEDLKWKYIQSLIRGNRLLEIPIFTNRRKIEQTIVGWSWMNLQWEGTAFLISGSCEVACLFQFQMFSAWWWDKNSMDESVLRTDGAKAFS